MSSATLCCEYFPHLIECDSREHDRHPPFASYRSTQGSVSALDLAETGCPTAHLHRPCHPPPPTPRYPLLLLTPLGPRAGYTQIVARKMCHPARGISHHRPSANLVIAAARRLRATCPSTPNKTERCSTSSALAVKVASVTGVQVVQVVRRHSWGVAGRGQGRGEGRAALARRGQSLDEACRWPRLERLL